MRFYLLFFAGLAGGLLGGMGMGGGTLLIPLLTLLAGVAQPVAQGVNLLAFLPMSALALAVHAREGRLCTEGLLFLVLPALLFSAAAALLAAFLPPFALKRGFGLFLIVLSVIPFLSVFHKKDKFTKNWE